MIYLIAIGINTLNINFKSVVNFISRNIGGILLIIVGIFILLKLDTIISIIAKMKIKLEKKREKGDSKVKPYKSNSDDKQMEIVDIEYKVKK